MGIYHLVIVSTRVLIMVLNMRADRGSPCYTLICNIRCVIQALMDTMPVRSQCKLEIISNHC